MTINPVKVGDLVVLSMQLHTTGISITGITGGNTGGWQRAVAYNNTGTDTLHYEVWWGVATATGPSAVNITYSANVSQWAIELTRRLLHHCVHAALGGGHLRRLVEPIVKLGIVAGSDQ